MGRAALDELLEIGREQRAVGRARAEQREHAVPVLLDPDGPAIPDPAGIDAVVAANPVAGEAGEAYRLQTVDRLALPVLIHPLVAAVTGDTAGSCQFALPHYRASGPFDSLTLAQGGPFDSLDARSGRALRLACRSLRAGPSTRVAQRPPIRLLRAGPRTSRALMGYGVHILPSRRWSH